MSLERDLQKRSNSICELCASKNCITQIDDKDATDANHWRCLNDSMWSEYNPVKVIAWRMLNRLKAEGWPQGLLDMLYLEDEILEWAKATGEGEADENAVIHRDVNGVILKAGDSVVLIKDLKVKGSSMIRS